MDKASLSEKLAVIGEHWRPKVVAQLNGQELKLVKFAGVFPWHHHEKEDEMFLVWRGQTTIEFRGHRVTLQADELCVVPRCVEHRTMVEAESEVLVFEPAETRNTGNIVDETFTTERSCIVTVWPNRLASPNAAMMSLFQCGHHWRASVSQNVRRFAFLSWEKS